MSNPSVVIVGAGACGLLCALRLKHFGIDALVIERDASPSGSTALSSGFIPAAQTRTQQALGLEDSFEIFVQDIQNKAMHQAPPHLVRAYVEAIGPALDWLEYEHGFEFQVLDGFLYPGHRVRRMHSLPEKTGAALIARLSQQAAAKGVDLLCNSKVVGLELGSSAPVHEDRPGPATLRPSDAAIARIGALRYQTPAGTIETLAVQSVMLACNGYGGNPDLVRRYIPEMSQAVFAGHSGNDGSALILGEAIGAASADLSAFQGHGSWAVPQGALISWALMMDGGIQVNSEGRRFHNETQGYSEAAVAVLAQPGAVAWVIVDERGLSLARSFPDFLAAEGAGALRVLSSLGTDFVARVLDTVRSFGEAAFVDCFGRQFERPLNEPLYAIKVTGALFHTQGGLQVDEQCRVLGRTSDTRQLEIIPGLWAGGGAARGVSGQTVRGYLSGNGLLSAVAGGWIAAESIARTMSFANPACGGLHDV
jgi:fumarate reductase flavoprotein subunit